MAAGADATLITQVYAVHGGGFKGSHPWVIVDTETTGGHVFVEISKGDRAVKRFLSDDDNSKASKRKLQDCTFLDDLRNKRTELSLTASAEALNWHHRRERYCDAG